MKNLRIGVAVVFVIILVFSAIAFAMQPGADSSLFGGEPATATGKMIYYGAQVLGGIFVTLIAPILAKRFGLTLGAAKTVLFTGVSSTAFTLLLALLFSKVFHVDPGITLPSGGFFALLNTYFSQLLFEWKKPVLQKIASPSG